MAAVGIAHDQEIELSDGVLSPTVASPKPLQSTATAQHLSAETFAHQSLSSSIGNIATRLQRCQSCPPKLVSGRRRLRHRTRTKYPGTTHDRNPFDYGFSLYRTVVYLALSTCVLSCTLYRSIKDIIKAQIEKCNSIPKDRFTAKFKKLSKVTGPPGAFLIGLVCLLTIWLAFRANTLSKRANDESSMQTALAKWSADLAFKQDCENRLEHFKDDPKGFRHQFPDCVVATRRPILAPPFAYFGENFTLTARHDESTTLIATKSAVLSSGVAPSSKRNSSSTFDRMTNNTIFITLLGRPTWQLSSGCNFWLKGVGNGYALGRHGDYHLASSRVIPGRSFQSQISYISNDVAILCAMSPRPLTDLESRSFILWTSSDVMAASIDRKSTASQISTDND